MAEHVGVDVGDTAPDVTGQLVRPGGEVADVSLATLAADKPVLLSFYTVDFSPDCIEEWCSFRDFDWFATGEEVQVVGVSKSGIRTHQQFIKRLNLGFPLYSDGNLNMAEAFGVDYRAFGVSRRARRSCFLLDESMEVRYKWVGEHWLDPSRDTPPVGEIHDAIQAELGGGQETFGF
jgi:peroxiredoxin Q/BCP